MAIPHVDERSLELHAALDWVSVFRRVAVATGAFAGGFILAGFSEQWTITQLLILLALAVWFRHEALWTALMGTVAGFGVVMVAPGNAVRAAMLERMGAHGLPFMEAARETLYQTALMIGQTLVYRFYAVVPVLMVSYTAGKGQRIRKRSAWLLGAFVMTFALIALSIGLVLLITGHLDYRGFTGATFVLLVGCAIVGYLTACRDE